MAIWPIGAGWVVNTMNSSWPDAIEYITITNEWTHKAVDAINHMCDPSLLSIANGLCACNPYIPCMCKTTLSRAARHGSSFVKLRDNCLRCSVMWKAFALLIGSPLVDFVCVWVVRVPIQIWWTNQHTLTYIYFYSIRSFVCFAHFRSLSLFLFLVYHTLNYSKPIAKWNVRWFRTCKIKINRQQRAAAPDIAHCHTHIRNRSVCTISFSVTQLFSNRVVRTFGLVYHSVLMTTVRWFKTCTKRSSVEKEFFWFSFCDFVFCV